MAAPVTLPLIHPLELSRPLAPLRALAGLSHPFVLQSAAPDPRPDGPRRARWTYFGADPFAVFRAGDHAAAIETFRRFARRAPVSDGERAIGAPFSGGAVGYWSYDYARRLETLPSHAADDLGLPDYVFALYDVVGAYDHDTRQTWLFSSGLPLDGEPALVRARERLTMFRERLLGPERTFPPIEHAENGPSLAATFTPERWASAVLAVQEHIRRGDIYQANLTQRWRLELPGAIAIAPALYESMTRFTPAPHAAYLEYEDHAVLSASPERFLELRGGHVETRPIKGTRPRGADPDDDARLAAELLASEKDRAENVMIVDVLRNDLGRVADPGTVVTTGLCELETFEQVHHLTSTITARLREGLDAFDLLHACFPGGSITGAPKRRAMEILETLEPVRRHVYTGAIGWMGWDGDADWNIAIRTATVLPDGLLFHAGGGITADSDPAAEYAESLTKAEGIRLSVSKVLGQVRLGEPVTGPA